MRETEALQRKERCCVCGVTISPGQVSLLDPIRGYAHADCWTQRQELMAPTPDPVNHLPHYTSHDAKCKECGHPIECIDVIESMSLNVGTAIKYLWRGGLKDGSPIEQDYRKAIWYLEREIERLGRK